jgi:hypothetical protein
MNASLKNRPDLDSYRLPADEFYDQTAPVNESAPAETPAGPRIAELVREFNADVAHMLDRREGAIDQSRNDLIPEKEVAALPPRARLILDRYAVADALALHYRNRTRTTFIRLLVAAFLAMLIFEVFAHGLAELFPIGQWPRLVFWLFPILWLGAWGLWYHAHCRQYQKKYHDYRALAEGLRVQFFWNLLGLPDPVEEYYLRKQQGELEWIRRAIAWWRGRDEKAIPASELSADQLKAHKDLVRRFWIQGQFDYFTKAGPRERDRGKRCKRWGAVLFWTSLGLAVILGGLEVWRLVQAPAEPDLGLPREEAVLIIAIALLLAGAAIAVAYGEKMAFSEHTRQYAGTRILFHQYDRQLTPGPLTPEEIELFRTLGKAALQENGDWLLIHRDRPLELIVP